MALPNRDVGLVLSGGGARGAYQAGVAAGIAELVAKRGGSSIPFSLIAGASAGAINASFLAARADDFIQATRQLAAFWSDLKTRQVFRTDFRAISKTSWQWTSDLALGNLKRHKGAQALLDTSPLRHLLEKRIPFERIKPHIDSGILKAFEVTATDYATSDNVSFFMSRDQQVGWTLPRRRAFRDSIGIDHVMASSAIPVLFPPVRVGERHYGDGCLRNPAPLGPAIRLGARRLLIVGVRHGRSPRPGGESEGVPLRPTVGRILSVVLNAILMDSMEFDVERLSRINEMIAAVPPDYRAQMPKQAIEYLYLRPSTDLGAFAAEHVDSLPDMVRYLISGLGSREEASELISYLFFESEYCAFLTQLGRDDALRQRDQIEDLLFGNHDLST